MDYNKLQELISNYSQIFGKLPKMKKFKCSEIKYINAIELSIASRIELERLLPLA